MDASNSNPIRYGGHDRFELELEFVQMLANPLYLQHLASQKFFDDESFVAYLSYLQYFRRPEYLRYLQYPAPTLHALEMLQQPRFRNEILIPDVVARMVEAGFTASTSSSSGEVSRPRPPAAAAAVVEEEEQ